MLLWNRPGAIDPQRVLMSISEGAERTALGTCERLRTESDASLRHGVSMWPVAAQAIHRGVPHRVKAGHGGTPTKQTKQAF